jgi:hypothetical protein|tara:strand:+ start:8316 stop:8684 length:369 start_codon:yes stop_codon:yes gene_type:complete
MKKDLNEIAKYEKAIKEKYGKEAIQNPKQNWTEEKEKKYLQHLKDFYKNSKHAGKVSSCNGFDVINKKKSKSEPRVCPVCHSYSHKNRDDLYMRKFQACFDCYIQFIEGREERWNSGWRPNK